MAITFVRMGGARFAEVILPLAVPGSFTYAIPAGLGTVQPGVRVAVPFGRNGKLYGGVVLRMHDEAPEQRGVRALLSVLDEHPVVLAEQLRLWERIAGHYLCTLGEVMAAALPAQLSLTSETRLVAAPDAGTRPGSAGRAAPLIAALALREVVSLKDAGELLGLKDPMPVVKDLVDRGVLMLEQQLREDWKPRTITYVRLAPGARSEEALRAWFDRLEEKSPKQLHVLMRYIELSRCLSDDPQEVERDKLIHLSGADAKTIRHLVDKGLLETYRREAFAPPEDAPHKPAPVLSPAQQEAIHRVRAGFAGHRTVLLRGVTSSGKTEIYAALMREAMARGEQVLYLLPEIALTTQIIARLRQRLGEGIAVAHSRMPQHERTALWMRMARGEAPPVVVGARSALFLPFRRLGLVVVDEEHDTSYKQHDPAPRYHARDMAIVLGELHRARVLLGSATPSMESLHNAHTGRYGHVELLERFGDAVLPTVTRVDLRDAARRKLMRGHFSTTLIDAIQGALGRREQVILFQNRRGYVPVWQCESCGWVPFCEHCDASLTYHKQEHRLRCHYCTRHYPPPTVCGQCGGARLRMIGLGTERIEEELAGLFPTARIARMDQDTTRGRHAMERILTAFGQGATDILVGTQMVTKGLDFGRVSVVGILNADRMLRFPDFRAHERAFHLMAQVAGRSGRRKEPGTVIIQAHDPHHPVLDLVARHDVEGMYRRELEHRRAHGYPPFTRLVEFTLKHRHEDRVATTAMALATALRTHLGGQVLGPDIPLVARIRDLHLRKLLVKLRRSAHHQEKAFLRECIDRVFAEKGHSTVRLVVDVDPL